MTLLEALQARHSVRSYTAQPIDPGATRAILKSIKEINEKEGLHFQLVLEEPHAFTSLLSYGKFKGVRNYIVCAGRKGAEVAQKIGYWGEHLVLEAQTLGLGSCWVGLTYRKTVVRSVLLDLQGSCKRGQSSLLELPSAAESRRSQSGSREYKDLQSDYTAVRGRTPTEREKIYCVISLGYATDRYRARANERIPPCADALQPSQDEVKARANERIPPCADALQPSQDKVKAHKQKTPEEVSNVSSQTPSWFNQGVKAALLAPTAINQQKFFFEFTSQTRRNKPVVRARKKFSIVGYTDIDLGIAKYHFEIGAGKENFVWADD